MQFQLKTSSHFYSANQISKYVKLGFTFKEVDKAFIAVDSEDFDYIIDGSPIIEFTSLEQLMEFSREWGSKLIVSTNGNGQQVLEIYNGYRE